MLGMDSYYREKLPKGSRQEFIRAWCSYELMAQWFSNLLINKLINSYNKKQKVKEKFIKFLMKKSLFCRKTTFFCEME